MAENHKWTDIDIRISLKLSLNCSRRVIPAKELNALLLLIECNKLTVLEIRAGVLSLRFTAILKNFRKRE